MPLETAIHAARAVVWGAPTLALLLGTGLYFTVRTRAFQLRRMGLWLRKTLLASLAGGARRTAKAGAVSPFAAMCTALAATVGTGNIAGVATALTLGGAGAVFWMWVAALVGMMTAFAETALGMRYRRRAPDGTPYGGAMYYLRDGLGSPVLAAAFALFCTAASFGVGNMVQTGAIADGLRAVYGVPPRVTALVVAAALAAVLWGGLGRLTRVTAALVPLMALLYMGGAALALWHGRALLPEALASIFREAFDLRAGAGGAAGWGVMQALRTGIARGVFSNEAGLGSAVMVHTAAEVREPAEQGLWAIFEVFFDTIVMCTMTALVLLTSGVFPSAAGADGAALTARAFSAVFGAAGGRFVAVSLALFAFSTLLGWSYYGQRAAQYLFGAGAAQGYRVLFVAAAAAGCLMRLELVWAFSDLCNGLMALPNLVGVIALRREALAAWRRFEPADRCEK